MSQNYSPKIPRDKTGVPLQHVVGDVALGQFSSENATASSVVSVTHDTTALEIAAVDTTGFMRFVTTGDTEASVVAIAGATANYDHVIPAGTVRRFVIPIETEGTGYTSVQGLNRGEGLFQRVAYKSAGISSILVTEY